MIRDHLLDLSDLHDLGGKSLHPCFPLSDVFGHYWSVTTPSLIAFNTIKLVPIILGVGLALLIETAKPGAAYGSPLISQLGTAFWSISVSLNVISTSLIAGQLLWHRRSLQQVGLHQGDKYIGITAILVESAGLYSICGLIYIPLFAQNLPLQYPFSALLNSVTVRSP